MKEETSQMIQQKYNCEQLYVNTLDNLKEWTNSQKHKILPIPNNEEIESLIRHKSSTEI